MTLPPQVDPYQLSCPDCGAVRSAPCTYLPIAGQDDQFLHYRSAKMQARAALTGTPTKRPHNGRLNRAAEVAARRFRRTLMQPPVTPASADRIAAARAEREFQRREYEELRAWLAVNARLLTG